MRKKVLAIDPSFTTMGVAFMDIDSGKIISMKTSDFMGVYSFINKNCKLSEIIVVIENPALNKSVFKMWGFVESSILDMCRSMFKSAVLHGFPVPFIARSLGFVNLKLKKNQKPTTERIVTIDNVRSEFAKAMNYAQKVGENKAAAKLMIKMMATKKVPIVQIAPSQRKRADKIKEKAGNAKVRWETVPFPTKMNAEEFNAFTGWNGRSSEHSRDAAMLFFGKNRKWLDSNIVDESKVPKSYPRMDNNSEFLFKRR